MTIKLSKPFTANNAVDEFDVRQMKGVLNRLGYYQPYEKTGITGIPDTGVFAALKAFQKDHGLPSTGMAKPGDKTIETLNAEAGKTPEGFYVWRTCEDDKVRAIHAAHDWETRAWGDSPDPSEEFNCRCWAAPATSEQVEKKKKQKCFDKLLWKKKPRRMSKAMNWTMNTHISTVRRKSRLATESILIRKSLLWPNFGRQALKTARTPR